MTLYPEPPAVKPVAPLPDAEAVELAAILAEQRRLKALWEPNPRTED